MPDLFPVVGKVKYKSKELGFCGLWRGLRGVLRGFSFFNAYFQLSITLQIVSKISSISPIPLMAVNFPCAA